jgi:anti-sigma factor RsiW
MGETMHDHEKCRALFEKLSEYIDSELDQLTCETIEKHVVQCKPCQTCLTTLKRTVDLCREMEPMLGHVNCYLDDRPDELQEELDDAVEAVMALAEDPFETSEDYFREILELRLAAGELALRASQSAMLHTGAKGYLQTAPAQRKLRESYFVAIVTPAIKHLRKELDTMAEAA